jgi:PhnB protein
MELVPYIFFYGRCEEALEFYKGALGGSYQLMRVADTPMSERFPPEAQQNVMHATFTAPGFAFAASDGQANKTIDPDEGNVSLLLTAPDRASGDRVFAALADGGEAIMPLDVAFWGGRYGLLHDRFGIEWIVTGP